MAFAPYRNLKIEGKLLTENPLLVEDVTLTVPVHSATELTQTYEDLKAQALYRRADGTAALRKSWSNKLRTQINGRGLIPLGLQEMVEVSDTVTLWSIGHRSVWSTKQKIMLPDVPLRKDLTYQSVTGATLTDKWCYARKWIGDSYVQATGTVQTTTTGGRYFFEVTLATGESIASYTGIEVVYFPRIIGYPVLDATGYAQNSGFDWSLTVEQA